MEQRAALPRDDKHRLVVSHVLRLLQGHFVLSCFLVLFLRENIPVLQGQGKFAGLLQGLIPHQSVVLDTGTPVFGAVLEASGS